MNATQRKTKAVLLAGGLGTRLRPLTNTVPKCLVEIAGRPLLDYWFQALRAAGITDVLVNNHHLPDAVRAFLDAKRAEGFNAVEAYEPTLLGSAGTVAHNRAWADGADDVLIIYADNLSSLDLSTFMASHRAHGLPMTMLLFHAPNPKACGIAEVDVTGRIVDFVEKPAEPKSDLANAGVYAVTADAWREMADAKAFDLGFDVLPKFVGRMQGHVHEGYHRDIGNLDALEAARAAAPRVFAGRFN
ncbi:nucleotidyltransferase family protein [Piscinibacter sp. HJYY11]|uniref:nucleotidyltransferase family protein n=1 Tax=Piscinibacter sp. HJYY11 TaxID=2801333 RepID=UPI00191D8FE1|nr:nucleotidyltransferase family protein [Piscinibacter sp. HJYY11]MBL0730337.1 nucleotidyltransferase family protein [Piscinibacter sp. HJYY11]